MRNFFTLWRNAPFIQSKMALYFSLGVKLFFYIAWWGKVLPAETLKLNESVYFCMYLKSYNLKIDVNSVRITPHNQTQFIDGVFRILYGLLRGGSNKIFNYSLMLVSSFDEFVFNVYYWPWLQDPKDSKGFFCRRDTINYRNEFYNEGLNFITLIVLSSLIIINDDISLWICFTQVCLENSPTRSQVLALEKLKQRATF